MGHEKPPMSYMDMYTASAALSRQLVPIREASEMVALDHEERIQPSTETRPAKPALPASLFARVSGGLSLHDISPREMATFSLDLYATGVVSFEEYEMLAFQPELHPDYDATVGALTGEFAKPDKPKDYIDHWEDRLAFVRRYNPQNTELVRRTERLVELLVRIERAPVADAEVNAA